LCQHPSGDYDIGIPDDLQDEVFILDSLDKKLGDSFFYTNKVGRSCILFQDGFPGSEYHLSFVVCKQVEFINGKGFEHSSPFCAKTGFTAMLITVQTIRGKCTAIRFRIQ